MATSPKDETSGGRLPDGYEAEFAALYREHHEFVWRMLRRFGVPPEWIEDATQEVFVVCHRRRHDYHSDVAIRSWLFGITRRVAAYVRRGEHRFRRRLQPVPAPRLAPSPDEELAYVEATAFVENFLKQLPEDQRIVFTLVDIEGMTGPEVVDALGGARLNTVYSRLRLVRRAFEKALKRHRKRGTHG